MPDLFTLLLLIIAAFFAGLIDAVAGGGGLITVPVLLSIGLPPRLLSAPTNSRHHLAQAVPCFILSEAAQSDCLTASVAYSGRPWAQQLA